MVFTSLSSRLTLKRNPCGGAALGFNWMEFKDWLKELQEDLNLKKAGKTCLAVPPPAPRWTRRRSSPSPGWARWRSSPSPGGARWWRLGLAVWGRTWPWSAITAFKVLTLSQTWGDIILITVLLMMKWLLIKMATYHYTMHAVLTQFKFMDLRI